MYIFVWNWRCFIAYAIGPNYQKIINIVIRSVITYFSKKNCFPESWMKEKGFKCFYLLSSLIKHNFISNKKLDIMFPATDQIHHVTLAMKQRFWLRIAVSNRFIYIFSNTTNYYYLIVLTSVVLSIFRQKKLHCKHKFCWIPCNTMQPQQYQYIIFQIVIQ